MTSGPRHNQVAAFSAALLTMDRVGATRLLLSAGGTVASITVLEGVVVPAFDEIGRSWEAGDLSLSQVYMSAKICEELVAGLPGFAGPCRQDQPRVAIASLNDHHLLGKKLVLSMMRACGFEVADYGVVDAEALAAQAHADRVDVLLVSVLMLRSALGVRALRAALDARGHHPRLIVGGAPFRLDPALWREVGADGCGRTASDAVRLVEQCAGQA